MNLFGELRRRNVFRVGIGYAVAGWVLLQVVDLVLENIVAPDWVMKVFMLAVAVGFPIAVIIAWAFEMTPEGIKRESEIDRAKSVTQSTGRKLDRIIIGFLALAVVLLVINPFELSNEESNAFDVEIPKLTAPQSVAPSINLLRRRRRPPVLFTVIIVFKIVPICFTFFSFLATSLLPPENVKHVEIKTSIAF